MRSKNCNNCKKGFLSRCEVLKENKEYQKAIKDYDMMKHFEFKGNFVCDNHDSMYIEYPIEVSKINVKDNKNEYKDSEVGKFVAISPCGDEYKGKTYLGLYLGSLSIGSSISHDPKTKELNISPRNNPAIFVFELNKIIYGIESFWRIIDSEEDLEEITEDDIENVWYVKALQSLKGGKENE